MKQARLYCSRCDEDADHKLVWRETRQHDWRLFARCPQCSRLQPAPQVINRELVALPDVARRQQLLFVAPMLPCEPE
ncbi:MAG: hypothetical protein R3C01_16335 [Planctomycetaceae bacterium]